MSCNNGGKYKVDLSDMAIFNSTAPRDTRIRIMTDNGYVYTFGGGGYSSLEYNALAWKSVFHSKDAKATERNEINAYYLTEIQAPNGRTLTIRYKDDIDKEYHIDSNKLRLLYEKPISVIQKNALQYSLSAISKFQSYRSNASSYFDENPNFEPERDASFALTKMALIDQISTGECVISFTYSAREKFQNYGDAVSSPDVFPYVCGAKLDEVTLKHHSYTEKAQLDYTYACGNRMFLNSVKNKEGKYSFQYKANNEIYPIPTSLTYNIDHWGFWRGNKLNSGIIPRMKPGTYYDQDYIITSNDRDPTGENCDYTLLQKMTYPTGGYTRFEYEPHWYSSIPRRVFTTYYYTGHDYPSGVHDALAGGARIRSVTHYEQNKAVKKIIYTYGSTMFMGELMYMPCYRYLAHHINNNGNSVISYISFDSEGITDISYPSVHIRYPEVTEHFVNPTANDLSEKHPYKTTEFVHGLSETSNYKDDFSYATAPSFPYLTPDEYFKYSDIKWYNKNLLAHPTIAASLKYGKVQKESFYNEDRQLVQQTNYNYTYLNNEKCALRIYSPASHFGLRTGLYTHIINKPFYEYALMTQTTLRYIPGNSRAFRQIPEWYEYDENGYLSRHSVLQSNGDSLVREYTRVHQTFGSRIQVLPTEESLSVIGPNKKLLLKRDTISYALQQSFSTSNKWYIPYAITSYDGSGRMQSVKKILLCDGYGNPIEIETNHSERVIYLWGYYGRRLIAQIKDATYSEVTDALGMSPLDVSLQPFTLPSISDLQARLPKARVYTYEYDSCANISGETAPDGKTIYYNYDTKARLVKSYCIGENGKQEILQLNNYHIINE